MGWEWAFKTPPLPSPPRSSLEHRKTRKSQGQWKGQEDWEYVHQREQSLRDSLCQKGAAHTALKHLACGDRGRGCPNPL